MADKNQTEKDKLYEWACSCVTREIKEKYFPAIDREAKSYYEERDSRQKAGYCREYTYETVPELKAELASLWDGDAGMVQIEKAVLVAAMKNKPSKETTAVPEEVSEKMKELTPFIYNF